MLAGRHLTAPFLTSSVAVPNSPLRRCCRSLCTGKPVTGSSAVAVASTIGMRFSAIEKTRFALILMRTCCGYRPAAICNPEAAREKAAALLNGYLAEYLKSCAKRLYREYERDEEADLSEGWHWTTIGEISEMVCRGITPKYNDASDELILGQTCIRNNLVLLENGRLHAPRKITEKWLKKYDLLINSTGVGSLGRTAQVWFDPSKLVVDSHVTIVRAADPRHALYMGFWAFEHERYIESLHTGSTGQTELPRDHVKAIRLVLPSDAELEKFNAVAQPAVELIVANQKESKRLAELRDTLLPKLMSGEIDVSNVAI